MSTSSENRFVLKMWHNSTIIIKFAEIATSSQCSKYMITHWKAFRCQNIRRGIFLPKRSCLCCSTSFCTISLVLQEYRAETLRQIHNPLNIPIQFQKNVSTSPTTLLILVLFHECHSEKWIWYLNEGHEPIRSDDIRPLNLNLFNPKLEISTPN